jgi:cytochrome oxidase assembly protein ShyY1
VSFRFLLQPKWIAWTLVVVVAVGVMANLSGWQLGRLGDRRATNAAIEARSADPVVPVDDPALAGLSEQDLRYRAVTATGVYLTDDEVLIANQTMGGAPGWWLVTPLQTPSGLVVMVNRGWVPFASVEPEGSFDAFAPPRGEVGVAGVLQSSQAAVVDSDVAGRALPRLDVAAASAGLTAPVFDLWLQLEDQQPAQPADEPIMLSLPALDDGPHLNYAGQWAIFAALTAIVFVVLVIRTAQRGDAGSSVQGRRGRGSEPALLVQLGVRLAPLVSRQRLAEVSGMPEAEVVDRLNDLVAAGLATHHDTMPPGWTLTSQGWSDLSQRLARELDDSGLRPAMTALYQRFSELNPVVLEVCTDWQVRQDPTGALVVNDHSDAAYDQQVIGRLGAVHDQAGPLCDELAATLARFGSYRDRLGAAVGRVESGDTGWIDRPMVDSYHTVWFELHEHLLATLGRERGDTMAAAVGGGATAGNTEAGAAGNKEL